MGTDIINRLTALIVPVATSALDIRDTNLCLVEVLSLEFALDSGQFIALENRGLVRAACQGRGVLIVGPGLL